MRMSGMRRFQRGCGPNVATAFLLAAAAALAQDTRVVTEPGPVNLRASGEDVTATGTPGAGSPNSCVNKFVPFAGEMSEIAW